MACIYAAIRKEGDHESVIRIRASTPTTDSLVTKTIHILISHHYQHYLSFPSISSVPSGDSIRLDPSQETFQIILESPKLSTSTAEQGCIYSLHGSPFLGFSNNSHSGSQIILKHHFWEGKIRYKRCKSSTKQMPSMISLKKTQSILKSRLESNVWECAYCLL